MNIRLSRMLWQALVVTYFFVALEPVRAAPVMVHFVSVIHSADGEFADNFQPGDQVQGSYTFESTVADTNPRPNKGQFHDLSIETQSSGFSGTKNDSQIFSDEAFFRPTSHNCHS